MAEPIFRDISADDENPEVTEIESMCMNCHENGTTKLLLTKIPFFKEVIISSFECPHCFFKDSEIQSASLIQKQGVRFTLKVDGTKDLSRQVVKQPSAMFRIEELDFEAPPFTSKGILTTIEGLIQSAIDGLEQQQPVRRIMEPEIAQKIDEFIGSLNKYKEGEVPFTMILEDSSGNSFIENLHAPSQDPAMKIENFTRTQEQNEKLGISEAPAEEDIKEKEDNVKDEVLEFQVNCHGCGAPTVTRMKVVQIPHFKEVVIMASDCEACGEKTNEVKAGGGIEEKGTKILLKITDPTDLSRDVLTSEMCTLKMPDLDLELVHSSDAGRFTTIEGLLKNIQEGLGRINPFAVGDSATKDDKIKNLNDKIQEVIDGKLFITLELDDPLGNSHVQNIYAPDPDPNLVIEKYERTAEMEDELGISGMNTETYEQ